MRKLGSLLGSLLAALLVLTLAPSVQAQTGGSSWLMDETSGTVMVDSSGVNNNGTLHGVTLGQPARPGDPGSSPSSYGFDGTTSYVVVNDSPTLNPGTQDMNVTAWVNLSGTPGTGTTDFDIIRKGGGWKMEMFPHNGKVDAQCLFAGSVGGTRVRSEIWAPQHNGIGLDDHLWHQVTCSRDASGERVIVDGYVVAQSSLQVGSISNTNPVYVGAQEAGVDFYNGLMDDVTVTIGTSPPPGAPSNLSTTSVLSNEIDLAWTASPTAGVTYDVYRGATCATLNSTAIATGLGTTSYSNTGLTASTGYAYTVDAFDGTNHSTASNCVTATTTSGGGATNLLSNGDFEQSGGSLTGWATTTNATLALASDGDGGVHAGKVAVKSTNTATSYSLKSSPQPVSAIGGAVYTADAMVRSDITGRSMCLKIAETTPSGTAVANALKCASLATTTWGAAPEVTYTAHTTADVLVVWVYQKAPVSGDTFEADNITLTTTSGGGPGAPSNLSTTSVLSNEIDLAWTASPTAGVTYDVYRGATCATLNSTAIATGLGTTSYSNTGLSSSTGYAYTVDAFDGVTHSIASNCVSATTTSDGGTDPIIAAVGDISCDPLDPNFNGGNGQNNKCAEKATSALVAAGSSLGHPYEAVLPLGDLQYDCGSLSNFNASYDPAWGLFSPGAYPVPGNHEYNTGEVGCNANATGYFQYFASKANPYAAGVNGYGYYSYSIGTWHAIALNSDCAHIPKGSTATDGCATGSPQETWLMSDLSANPSTCTLAYWHHAPWSSTAVSGIAAMRPIWADLASAGVDLVLVGHYHHYERFGDMNATGGLVPDGSGMRQIIVGTGGEGLSAGFSTPLPASQVRDGSTFGIISVTLGTGTYSWRFIPASPGTFTDSGTDTCH